jgi:hypothetical protein
MTGFLCQSRKLTGVNFLNKYKQPPRVFGSQYSKTLGVFELAPKKENKNLPKARWIPLGHQKCTFLKAKRVLLNIESS